MRKNLWLSIGFIGLNLVSGAFASTWTPPITVKSIESLADGSFILRANETNSGPNCAESGTLFKVYVSAASGLTEAGVKSALSIALTAMSTAKELEVWHDNTANCLVSSIRINGN